METKFHLLAVGQHFEWEGLSYVKTTPLLASQLPDGGQKFMPRAALVKVVGSQETPPVAPTPRTPLDGHAVRDALGRYHRRCLEISGQAVRDHQVIEEVRSGLEQVYRDLLDELKL